MVATKAIVPVVKTKIGIVTTLADTSFVKGVVEGVARGGSILVDEGQGLLQNGLSLASEIIKVCSEYKLVDL